VEESGFLAAKDGNKIYWQGWMPSDSIRGLILVSHGLGEHIARYGHLAEFLNNKGFAVFGSDHCGHGRSSGKRGHILSFDNYIQDYKLFRDSIVARFSGKQSFLLGHSLGGLIAVHYVLAHPSDFNGLIISSAALKIKIEANPVKLALGRFFSKFLPGITMGNELDPHMISHDQDVVKKYISDPLVHDRVSARWFTCFTAAIAQAQARAAEIKMPALVMQSSEDKLVDPDGAREFFEKLGSSDKTLKYWEGFYHEMFNEVEKQKPYEFLLNWLDRHLA
jgi:alpha-beta hydrolase superfamily lysophospholipase